MRAAGTSMRGSLEAVSRVLEVPVQEVVSPVQGAVSPVQGAVSPVQHGAELLVLVGKDSAPAVPALASRAAPGPEIQPPHRVH
jgi:hypothetical protein